MLLPTAFGTVVQGSGLQCAAKAEYWPLVHCTVMAPIEP
jgi:hypothetical protein